MKCTRKGLPFHQIVIFAHLTVVHYFYFICEKNYCLNKIYHISLKCFKVAARKASIILKTRQTPLPTSHGEFRPPLTQNPGSAPATLTTKGKGICKPTKHETILKRFETVSKRFLVKKNVV